MAHREPTRAQNARSTHVACSVSWPSGCGAAARYVLVVAVLCAAEAASVIGHPPSRPAAFVTGPVLNFAILAPFPMAKFARPMPLHASGLLMREKRAKQDLPFVAAQAQRPLAVVMKVGVVPRTEEVPLAVTMQAVVAPRTDEVRKRNLWEKLAAGYTAGLVARPLQTKMLTNLVSALVADVIKQARDPPSASFRKKLEAVPLPHS